MRRALLLIGLFLPVWAEEPLPEDPKELVKLLGDPSFDRREAAQKKLEAMGEKAEPALKEAAGSKDLEVAGRAQALLDCLHLAQVEMGISLAGEAKAGKPSPLRITVTNHGKESVLLLKFLAGQFQPDCEGPTAFLEVKDAQGREIPQGTVIRARMQSELEVDPYLELGPGESRAFDLGEGFNGLPLEVARPGRYTVTLVYILRRPFDLDRSIVDPAKEAVRRKAQGAKDPLHVLLGEIRSKPFEVEVTK